MITLDTTISLRELAKAAANERNQFLKGAFFQVIEIAISQEAAMLVLQETVKLEMDTMRHE